MKNQSSKLLIVYFDLGLGGIQTRISDIVEYWNVKRQPEPAEKINVLLTSELGPGQNPSYVERLIRSGAALTFRPPGKILSYRLTTFFYLFWMVLTAKPDVILTFLRTLTVETVLIRRLIFWRKIKLVVNEGIMPLMSLHDESKGIGTSCWKLLMKWSYPKTDRVIAPTASVGKELIKEIGVPPGKVVVSHHWSLKKSCLNVEEPGCSTGKKYDLLYTGRFAKQKRVWLIIELASMLAADKILVKVGLAGEGKESNRLKSLASEKNLGNQIKFLGRLDDVFGCILRSKIFVMTSSYEGMPVSILEAKAAGVPAVSLDFPGVREVIDDGIDGYICSDLKEMAVKVKLLLGDDNLRNKMGRRAQINWEEHFSESALVKFCQFVAFK